ncbi:hypothetical protein C1J03_06360 [Sulfitobacter sp. SK012]|uniref:hypothetical protein n=1 Tax=Sulfitobacter sp. SK012 TaxID=1389005 RepID=UPI000E0A561E|nr:hypothetical protein [Sulfitobacter sp. SK012]AXI45688.1 hypothetical protein C1J03_06360 [Sulfitobacter sp. SK012]
MIESHDHFEKRLNFLGRKHAKMTRGYATKMDRNGLLIAQPKRQRIEIPVRGILMLVFCFFAFKGFMLAANGPTSYAERLSGLQSGTKVEQIGAKLMMIDPATEMMAKIIGPIMR